MEDFNSLLFREKQLVKRLSATETKQVPQFRLEDDPIATKIYHELFYLNGVNHKASSLPQCG